MHAGGWDSHAISACCAGCSPGSPTDRPQAHPSTHAWSEPYTDTPGAGAHQQGVLAIQVCTRARRLLRSATGIQDGLRRSPLHRPPLQGEEACGGGLTRPCTASPHPALPCSILVACFSRYLHDRVPQEARAEAATIHHACPSHLLRRASSWRTREQTLRWTAGRTRRTRSTIV